MAFDPSITHCQGCGAERDATALRCRFCEAEHDQEHLFVATQCWACKVWNAVDFHAQACTACGVDLWTSCVACGQRTPQHLKKCVHCGEVP